MRADELKNILRELVQGIDQRRRRFALVVCDLISDKVEEGEAALRQVIALLLIRLYILRENNAGPKCQEYTRYVSRTLMISKIFSKMAAGSATGGNEASAAILLAVAAVPMAIVTTCSVVTLRRMYRSGILTHTLVTCRYGRYWDTGGPWHHAGRGPLLLESSLVD